MKLVKIIATGAIVLAALGMVAYKYVDYIVYPWTRDGLAHISHRIRCIGA
jgi:hypothetical protein